MIFSKFFSVDSLIGKFTKLVKQLEAKAVQHTKNGFAHSAVAEEYQTLAAFQHKEAAKATAIAAKIRNLVSGE